MDLCFQGNDAYCPRILRTNGVITGVRSLPTNIASIKSVGVDLNASYRIPAADIFPHLPGTLSVDVIGTRYLKNLTIPGIPGSVPIDNLGVNSGGSVAGNGQSPYWRLFTTVGYDSDRFTAALTARAISAGVYNKSYIECTSNCPASTLNNMTIDTNHLAGAVFFDLSTSYKFNVRSTKAEVFLNIKNIFNRDPPPLPVFYSAATHFQVLANKSYFDYLGAVFRLGVRIRV